MSSDSKSPYSFGQFIELINNNFIMIVVAGLLLIGGAFVGSVITENKMLKSGVQPTAKVAQAGDDAVPTAPEGPTADTLSLVPEVTEVDHIRGAQNAKITLIEYSDYECPYCGSFHPTTQQVLDEYGDDVRLVYRHYPLPFHPQAMPAAATSECVDDVAGNDAFWAFTDSLFAANTANGTITQEDIDAAVLASGASASEVASCVESGIKEEVVQEQMDAGAAAGIQGTPGTILVTSDGQYEMINGALPYAQVSTVIERYLN